MNSNAIYGGIIGDMVGSPYEWQPILKEQVYDFPLWTKKGFSLFKKDGLDLKAIREESHFTDDTVCGLGIAKAIIDSNKILTRDILIKSLREICKQYPEAGYGNAFQQWIFRTDDCPYNSFANGSAMRVFPIGLVYDSIEDTRFFAKMSAEITHDHEQGIIGAEAVASAMFLVRKGYDNKDIKDYITREFYPWHLNKTLDEIRPDYCFSVFCQESVPESILCFLEGNSYEECIRLAVSLGGDADTMGCITGSIASCRFDIDNITIKNCKKRLDKNLRTIAENFKTFI